MSLNISNLESSLALAATVKERKMKHNCPNYLVPYDPHFGIPLLPFALKTTLFYPWLRSNFLWNAINFVRAKDITLIARRNNLKLEFDKNHFVNTFERFDYEPEFRKKHPILHRIYLIAKVFGFKAFLNFLRTLPQCCSLFLKTGMSLN